jgi:hypothetical protein
MRAALIAAFVIAAAGVLFVLRVSREMPDFEVYWIGASRAAVAEPLYRPEDGHYQFKYLPAFAMLAIPLSLVSLPVAKGLWFSSSIVMLGLLFMGSLRILPERRRSSSVLTAIALITLGKFLARELLLGQANLLFAVIIVSALLGLKKGRDGLAGVLVGFAAAIKPYAIIFLPWLIARRNAHANWAATVAIGAVLTVPVMAYGLTGNVALHQAWWSTVTDTTLPNLLNPDNISLAAAYARWLGPGRTATWLTFVTVVCLAGTGLLVFRRRDGVRFPEGLEGGFLLTLIPLLSPQGWDYVLVVATPAVIFLANYSHDLPRALRTATVMAALTIGLTFFDLLGRDKYIAFMQSGTMTIAVLVLVAALAALRWRRIA